jgi:hypothetical protein
MAGYCWTCGKFTTIDAKTKLCPKCYDAWCHRAPLGSYYARKTEGKPLALAA